MWPVNVVPSTADDTDGVLVEVGCHVVRADRVLVLGQRHDARLHVEVAAELLPDDVHVAAEDEVGLVDRPAGGLPALPPLPLQGQGAEHDRLGRALGATARRLTGGVEEVGQHPHAALLDLGGDRVLRVVDEVAVQVLRDDPLRLGLHPRGDEGGEVALRVALHGEVLVEEPHRVVGRHAAVGEVPSTGRARSGTGCRRVLQASVAALRRHALDPSTVSPGDITRCGRVRAPRAGRSNSWITPPIAKHTAPANVPQLTRPTSSASDVAGRVKAATPARKKRTEPTWLTATIHQPSRGRRTPIRPWQTSSSARCPETRKQTQPTMSGQPDPPVRLPRCQALGERRDQADGEEERPDEQHRRAHPADVARLEAATSATGPSCSDPRSSMSVGVLIACSTDT